MSWIKILIFIIQYGPKIIGILKDIWEEIEDLEKPKRSYARKDLKLALADTRLSKSMQPLEDFRGRIRL